MFMIQQRRQLLNSLTQNNAKTTFRPHRIVAAALETPYEPLHQCFRRDIVLPQIAGQELRALDRRVQNAPVMTSENADLPQFQDVVQNSHATVENLAGELHLKIGCDGERRAEDGPK